MPGRASVSHTRGSRLRGNVEAGVLPLPTPYPRFQYLSHHEGVELVPVRVAEIGGVKALAPKSRRALVAAAVGQRDIVKPLHLGLIRGGERDHHAIADARRLAVERAGQADAGALRLDRKSTRLNSSH